MPAPSGLAKVMDWSKRWAIGVVKMHLKASQQPAEAQ
jgi:hypothetical protein